MYGDHQGDHAVDEYLAGGAPRNVEHQVVIICDLEGHGPRRIQTMTKYEGRLLWDTYSGVSKGVHIFPAGGMRRNALRDNAPRPARGAQEASLSEALMYEDVGASFRARGDREGDRENLDLACADCHDSIRFRHPGELDLVLDALAGAGQTAVTFALIRRGLEEIRKGNAAVAREREFWRRIAKATRHN